MSRNARIGIAVVIGIIAGCLCLCAAGLLGFTFFGGTMLQRVVVTQPELVRGAAEAIIDYELPPGFRETSSFSLLTARVVTFENDAGAMIFLMNVGGATMADTDLLRRQFERQLRNAVPGADVQWELQETRPTTVGGDEIEVYTYSGESRPGADRPAEAMTLVTLDPFIGKAGMVFLSIIGPADSLDKSEIDAFVDSIE